MSESHVHNRIQGEQAHDEAIQDEDEDSIENWILAVEHVVFDQSLQIEHLEKKNDCWLWRT